VIRHGVKGELNGAGLPLGMFCEAEFASTRLKLDDGDTLLLFTDGVTETVDHTEKEFGASGISTAVDGFAFAKPVELIDRCLEHVTTFRSSAEKRDDLSMLALSFI